MFAQLMVDTKLYAVKLLLFGKCYGYYSNKSTS